MTAERGAVVEDLVVIDPETGAEVMRGQALGGNQLMPLVWENLVVANGMRDLEGKTQRASPHWRGSPIWRQCRAPGPTSGWRTHQAVRLRSCITALPISIRASAAFQRSIWLPVSALAVCRTFMDSCAVATTGPGTSQLAIVFSPALVRC